MKLNPEELTVSSFDTTATAAAAPGTGTVVVRPITTLTDPTAATNCYWCPPATLDCY
jgi:hypothetical protein